MLQVTGSTELLKDNLLPDAMPVSVWAGPRYRWNDFFFEAAGGAGLTDGSADILGMVKVGKLF